MASSPTISDYDTCYSSDSESNDEYEEFPKIRTQITTKGLKTIYHEFLKSEKLNLKPEYQRDICWSNSKMNALIDTIMKQLVVPNFVIYKLNSREARNAKPYECIDGQHRFYTIEKYIKNEKHNNRYIYWKTSKGERVFYDLSPEQLKKMPNKVICRNMTPDEKIAFDDYQFCISVISSETHEPLSLKMKCDIFNRLQNGERVSSWIKLRNMPNIITQTICSDKILEMMNDNDFIEAIHFIRTKPKNHNAFNIYFAIRTFLIIDKQSLDINYLDLNIKKYLEANNYEGVPSVKITNDINNISSKVTQIIEYISDTEIPFKIIPELAYVYVCIYSNYGMKAVKKLTDYFNNNSEKLEYYNNLNTYCCSRNKVTSAVKLNEIYNNIIIEVLNKSIYDRHESKELRYNREQSKCFYDNEKLRHTIKNSSVWEFTYNKTINKFTYNRRLFNTLNQITTAHYVSSNPDRTACNNAWKECEVYRNGIWISTYDLPIIDESDSIDESLSELSSDESDS